VGFRGADTSVCSSYTLQIADKLSYLGRHQPGGKDVNGLKRLYGAKMKNLVDYAAILIGVASGFVINLLIFESMRNFLMPSANIFTLVILVIIRTLLSLLGICFFGLAIAHSTKIFVERKYQNLDSNRQQRALLWYAVAGIGIGMILYYHFIAAYAL
jgi:hypothetical protein